MQSVRHMAKPTAVHMAAVKRILRYLRGTPKLPVIYKKHSSFNLVGFCDVSYRLGDPEKIRSVTWSIFFVAGGLVYFSSQLQKISAKSTTGSETIAVDSCAKKGIYLPGILGQLGWKHVRTFRIVSDNRGALHLAANETYSNRGRNIAIRFAALRDRITKNRISNH